ncbi:hypothetical protein Bbelb_115870 [Branchiostoma belcheri]|nr:hypothetical protein Bbelb_115870 [Branchiostoma belcheri]
MTDQGNQNMTTDNSSTESGFVNVTKSPGVENWTTLATDVAAADFTDKLSNMDDFFNINLTNTPDYFSGDFVDVENSTVDSSIQDEAGYSTGNMTAKYSNQLALCYPTSEANMIGQLVGTFACIAVTWVYLVKTHRLMANQVHPQPVANQAPPLFPRSAFRTLVMQKSFRKALKRLFKDAVDFVWKHLTGHDVFGTPVVAFQRQDTFSQNAVTVGRSSETSPGDPGLEDDIPLRDMSNPQCDRHGVRDTHAPDSTRTLAWQHPTGTTPSPDPSDAGEHEAGGQGHHVHDNTTPTPDPSEAGEQEHHVHGHTTPTADPREAEEQGNHVNGHTAPTPDPSEAGEQGHHVHGHTTRTPDPSEAGGQEHHVHGHTTRTPDPSEAGEQEHHVHGHTTPTADPSEAGGQGNHVHHHTTPTPDPSEAGEQEHHVHGHTTPTADPSEAGGQGHHVHDHTTPTADPSEAGEQEHHVHGHTTPTADPSEAGGQGRHVHDHTTPTPDPSEAGEQEHHVHGHTTPTADPSEAGGQGHHVHDHTTPTPDPSEAGDRNTTCTVIPHLHLILAKLGNRNTTCMVIPHLQLILVKLGDRDTTCTIIPHLHLILVKLGNRDTTCTIIPHLHPILVKLGDRNTTCMIIPHLHLILVKLGNRDTTCTIIPHLHLILAKLGNRNTTCMVIPHLQLILVKLRNRETTQLPSATPTPTHAPASNTPVARRSHVAITRTTPAATPYLTVDQRPHGRTGPASPGTVTREHTLQTTPAHYSVTNELTELVSTWLSAPTTRFEQRPVLTETFLHIANIIITSEESILNECEYKAKALNIRPVHEIERQTICREENTRHRRPLHWGVSERLRSFSIKLLAVEKEPACRKL